MRGWVVREIVKLNVNQIYAGHRTPLNLKSLDFGSLVISRQWQNLI